ncbi:hypothetical protein B0A49_03518 [Cryomyces minteri]|uniref:Uncharacterized protein n=1 Tax=Cryomyces minteri TaxID=331657 RepID=A0A4U0XLB4_9PEZI|nr:hypothetical protein B0A49_03518 [Cryomyces minteri]
MSNRQNSGYIQPTLASVPVEIDPSAPGTVIRYALAIEAAANIFGGTAMVFFPSQVLSLMVTKTSFINPTTESLVQWLGALVYGLTVPVLLAIPNTRRGIESRQTVYYTLLGGEGTLIPTFLWHMTRNSGFTYKSLVASAVVLAATCGWRLLALFKRPDWLGRYRDIKKEE